MLVRDPRNGKKAPLDEDLRTRYAKEYSDWLRQDCTHDVSHQELRRGFNSGGGPVIRMQCMACGERIGRALSRREVENAEQLPEFDDTILVAYRAARKAAEDQINLKYVDIQIRRWRGQERGDEYRDQARKAYMETSAWRERRELVIGRASGVCEGCRKANATEVHHLSYLHLGNEFLFELVALCRDCHSRIHAKDDHEALVSGCKACLHASRGSYCRLFDLPMEMALDPEGPCTFERLGFEAAD
jgi:5-methylcytosine-specific restriction endonuclease McrA